MPKLAGRFQTLPEYPLATIPQKKRELAARGVDVIDLGAGDADLAPPPEALSRRSTKAVAHARDEPLRLRARTRAVSRGRLGVDAQALRLRVRSAHRDRSAHRLEGGDLASRARVSRAGARRDHSGARLQRVPGRRAARERRAVSLRAAPAHGLSRRPRRDSARDAASARGILYLNYPNNPTAAIAPRDYLERVVARCRELDILLVYDNAYSELAFDGYVPPSIFEIDGARDVAIEFHSLSKTYNMTGWRCGWAVAAPEIASVLDAR